MSKFSSNVGTFQLQILEVLRHGDLHGYKIMSEIETINGSKPTSAALYPALKKLEQNGYITSHLENHNNRERKIYHLTNQGHDELAKTSSSMVTYCCNNLQVELEAIQNELTQNLMMLGDITILYPSTMYESIHKLSISFNGLAKIIALVPSKVHKETIGAAVERNFLSKNITVMEGWVDKLPLNDSSLDVVFYPLTLCRCSPWDSPNQKSDIIKEVARVLKPNGKFVLIEFDRSSHSIFKILDPSSIGCGYEPPKVKKLFELSGFNNVTTNSRNGLLIIEGTRN